MPITVDAGHGPDEAKVSATSTMPTRAGNAACNGIGHTKQKEGTGLEQEVERAKPPAAPPQPAAPCRCRATRRRRPLALVLRAYRHRAGRIANQRRPAGLHRAIPNQPSRPKSIRRSSGPERQWGRWFGLSDGCRSWVTSRVRCGHCVVLPSVMARQQASEQVLTV